MTSLPSEVVVRRPATTVPCPAAVPTAVREGLVLNGRLVSPTARRRPPVQHRSFIDTALGPFRGESSETFVALLFLTVIGGAGLLGVLLAQVLL